MPQDESASEFRDWVRARTLEVAHEQLVERGWDRVRVGQIATLVGVSRPTIYAEFGSKEGIAEALVKAETTKFLLGAQARLGRYTSDPEKAIRVATRYAFVEAEQSPLLRAILTANDSTSSSMLPLLTVRSEPMFYLATDSLTAWFVTQNPKANHARIRTAVEALVRLLVSNLMFPGDRPSKAHTKVADIGILILGDALTTR